MTTPTVHERLEYLRGEIRAERISWGELAELQDHAGHIEPDDVELLEWAGVPEREPEVCGGTGNHDGQPVDSCDECAEHGWWEQ